MGIQMADAMAPTLTMTVDEAAALIGVSRNTLYEAIRRGEVPHLRMGRRIIIPKARFDEWLAGSRHDSIRP